MSLGNAYPTSINTIAPLDELSQSLNGAQERVTSSISRIRAIADNLFGALPEGKDGANSVRPSRLGRVGSLNDQAETIHSFLSDLDNQLARLSSL